MAKYRQGILGPISGKVGTVVGSSWKGINYIRAKPGPNKSNTADQQVQRAKFSMVIKFLATMRSLLDTYFADFGGQMTGSNSALAYTMQNAVLGNYPNLSIDYSKVAVTRGNLLVAEAAQAEAITPGELHFTWNDNSGQGTAKNTDRAVLVAFCKDLSQTLYITQGAIRSDKSGILPVSAFSGRIVQAWVSFLSPNGKVVSSSVYAGEFTIL